MDSVCKVGQAAGTIATLDAIGTLVLHLGQYRYVIPGVYLQKTAPHNLFGAGHLLRHLGFKKAIHDLFNSLCLLDKYHRYVQIKKPSANPPVLPYLCTKNGLDFMVCLVGYGVISSQGPSGTQALAQMAIASTSMRDNDTSAFWHLAWGHAPDRTIMHTFRQDCLKNIPSGWEKWYKQPPCWICDLIKRNKIPPSPTVSYASLQPGKLLFMDFAFVNEESIRGFTSILNIICASTDKWFLFCTRSKRPPINIIKFFLRYLKNIDRSCAWVRTDLGGELAKSTEFNRAVIEEGAALHDNGGYAPAAMGKVETRWKPVKSTIKTMVKQAPDEIGHEYWCFAAEYSAFLRNRLCPLGQTKSAYQKWYGNKPDARAINIFGCWIYTPIGSHGKLPALEDKNKLGLFLGYGATTANVLYKVPGERKISRCHKPHFDNFGLRIPGYEPSNVSKILRPTPEDTSSIESNDDTSFDFIKTPFFGKAIFKYDVELPVNGPYRLALNNDVIFNIPVITKIFKTSPFYKGLPARYRSNTFLLAINDEEPITSERAIEYLDYLRDGCTTRSLTIQVTVSKRPHQNMTEFGELRNYCDQLRPVISSAEIPSGNVDSSNLISFQQPYAAVAVKAIEPIPIPTNATLKSNPYREYWILSLFERYVKNMDVNITSAPISLSLLPPDHKVYRPVVVRTLKDTADADVVDLYTRICLNGSTQEEGVDFDSEPTPTCGHQSLRFVVAIAAEEGLEGRCLDVSNAFQSTPRAVASLKGKRRLFMRCPPLFVEWFKQKYPNFKIQGSPPYVQEVLGFLNGLRDASPEWYHLLKGYLKKGGFRPIDYDAAIFVYRKKEKDGVVYFALAAVLTDDILVFYSHLCIYLNLLKIMREGLKVTEQIGSILNFGNFRIVQSKHCITIDQTKHILETLEYFFDDNEQIPVTKTPLRTDKEFNEQMNLAIPATKEQLAIFQKQFKGSYAAIFGKILNIMTGTRSDIANALNRLGVFQAAPTEIGFYSLRRVLYYLKTFPNIPLVYPRHQENGSSTFYSGIYIDDKTEDTLVIPHGFTGHGDSSFAPFLRNRHSVQAMIEMFNAVIIGWRVCTQLTCEPSASGSELRASYNSNQRCKGGRNFMKDIGRPQTDPTPIFTDNRGARMFINGGKMTRNFKHMDIPICILNEDRLLGRTAFHRATTHTIMADTLTKIQSGTKLRTHRNFMFGIRFLTPEDSDHYQILIRPIPPKTDESISLVIIPISK